MKVAGRCVLVGSLVAGAIGVGLGCSADQFDIFVANARAPGDKCDYPDDSKYVEGGSVDFRPWIPPSGGPAQETAFFSQVFSWQNNLQPTQLVVNGQVVDTGNGSDFVADEAVLSYRFSDSSVVLPDEVENLRAVIPGGATRDKSSVGVGLIGANAAATLDGALNTTSGTLLVNFYLRGKLAAGKATKTNVANFPLLVYKSGTTPVDCNAPLPDGGQQTLVEDVCRIPGRNVTVGCVPKT
jgi:hypothetical protein